MRLSDTRYRLSCLPCPKRCVIRMVTRKQAHEMVPKMMEMRLSTGSSASSAPKMMAKLVRWVQRQTALSAVERRRSSSQPELLQFSAL